MKKIVMLAVLLAVSFVAKAQKVDKNEIDEKGTWHITTNFCAFYTENEMHGYTLSYWKDNSLDGYMLNFMFMEQAMRWEAQKKDGLLIKTASGEKHYIDCVVSKSQLARDRKGVHYMTSNMYYIPKDNIGILEDGLVKIRVMQIMESGNESYFDIELPEDVTTTLKKAVKNINKAIAQGATVDKSEF
jgi:hypothetical protein